MNSAAALVEALGLTLLHFLWQGTVVGFVLWMALLVSRKSSAHLRYNLAGVGLLIMVAWPIVTFFKLPVAAIRQVAPNGLITLPASPKASVQVPTAVETKAFPALPTLERVGAAKSKDDRSESPLDWALRVRPYLGWLVGLWAVGVTCLSVRFWVGWCAVGRMKKFGHQPEDATWIEQFQSLHQRLLISRPVVLLVSATATVPMVIGWFKPVVLVPAGLFMGLSGPQMEAILVHELAHIRRHDFMVNLLQVVVETLFFYHPAVWWISGQLRREREHCCDDIAASVTGSVLEYARALTALEKIRDYAPLPVVSAVGGSLLSRIRRLMGLRHPDAEGSSWPLAALVILLLAVLGPVALLRAGGEPPPTHGMAASLVKRWQALEERDTPISESHLAVLRDAIREFLEEDEIKGTGLSGEQMEQLQIFRNWRNERKEHPVGEVSRMLDAVAAIHAEPIQMAFNKEPIPGRVLTAEERSRLAFGPSGANGLRAAWSFGPRKSTYVLGDNLSGTLTLWNSGEQALVIGTGKDAPGLRPDLDFEVHGRDGREIAVVPTAQDGLAGKVKFTVRWWLKPGESAAFGNYSWKMGEGPEREETLRSVYASEFKLPDLQSGEDVVFSARVPYPREPGDATDHEHLQIEPMRFNVMAPDAIKAWATASSGHWPLAGGVQLHLYGEVFHGADVATTAVLIWPARENQPAHHWYTHVASDAFANRELWAVAWEADQPILWIAARDIGSNAQNAAGKPVANRFKRVDFSNPNLITETAFGGWPKQNPPSPGVIAQMSSYMEVPAEGDASSPLYSWSTVGSPERIDLAAVQNISIQVEKDGSVGVKLDEKKSCSVEKLAATIKELSSEWKAKRQSQLGNGLVTDRVIVSVPNGYSEQGLEAIVNACREAGCGPNQPATTDGSIPAVRGLSLAGFPIEWDVTNITELYEKVPNKVREFRQKAGVFTMSLGNLGPWVYFAANADHFYIERRPDPKIVKDLIYGPIPGHPVEKLDLAGWLKESPTHPDPGYAARVARDMIKCGDNALGQLALDWLGVFKAPSPPDQHDWLMTVIEEHLKANPQSAIGDKARSVLTQLKVMSEQAASDWDKLREKLPTESYSRGIPMGAEHASIVWADAAEIGMQIGIGGVDAGSRWKFGSDVTFDVYVRNDGKNPVKFAWTPRIDEGLYVSLKGPDGEEWTPSMTRWSTLLIHNRCQLDPGQILKVKSAAQFRIIQSNADHSQEEPEYHGNSFSLDGPGKFQLEIKCSLGVSDWADSQGKPHPRPAGEWSGTLRSKPIEVEIADQKSAKVVDPLNGSEMGKHQNISTLANESKIPTQSNFPTDPKQTNDLTIGLAENLSMLSLWAEPGTSNWLTDEIKGVTDQNDSSVHLRPELIPGGVIDQLVYSREFAMAEKPLGNRNSSRDPRSRQIQEANGLIEELIGSPAPSLDPADYQIKLTYRGFNVLDGSKDVPGLETLAISPADPALPPLDAAEPSAALQIGIKLNVLDSTGQQPIKEFRVIAGVPSSVSSEFEKAHGTRVANWQSHTLHVGREGGLIWPLDKAYDEMALRVEADGYVPEVFAWLDKKKGAQELVFKMIEDRGIAGRVMTPGGKAPANGATVVLAMICRDARLKGTTAPELDFGNDTEPKSLRDAWDRPRVVHPDAQGKFTLPTEIDPTAVVLIFNQDGVVELPYLKWRDAPDVALEPWGKIHGRVQWGKLVGAGEKVDLTMNRGDAYGYPGILTQNDSTTANGNGEFVFERVLPGLAQLSIPFKIRGEKGEEFTTYQEGMVMHANVSASQTEVMMGGKGRTVKGKLTGRDSWDRVVFHFHPTAPHIGFEGDNVMWKAWNDFKNSPKGPVFFRDGLKVNADGTFDIPGVLPGSYQIFFSKEGEKTHVATGQFRVGEENGKEQPAPMDVGEFKARPE